MTRVSATTLEAFRLWRDEDWMEEAALIANIKRETPISPAMALGLAFGAVLAEPERYAMPDGLNGIATYSCEGYDFAADVMTPALALFDRRGQFEVKTDGIYPGFSVGPVRLVARADQIVGNIIIENKTTLGSFDPDRYMESYQWRTMLEVFEANRVEYRIFSLSEAANGMISLRTIDTLAVYRYPRLLDDVRSLLAEFLEYATLRELLAYVQDPPVDEIEVTS